MPLYEFRCGKCDAQIEGIYPMGGGPKRHAGCGGTMEKVIGKCGIRFRQNVNHDVCGWSDTTYDPSTAHAERDWVLGDNGQKQYFEQDRKLTAKAIV